MCGIAGKISFGNVNVSSSDIERMNHAIAHRGPDGSGVYISKDNKIGLGHTRLAIVDISKAGAQPMRYMDRYEIVFNGEIYNFRELKADLEKLGYRFSSHTDTEVIMALYAQYGQACVQYLRGMFAFALYDEQEHTLFCARDRVGQKPFKYYVDERVFIFASEIKAILSQSEYKKQIDTDALKDFLVLQYTPGTTTGFLGIQKLEPATTLYIECSTGNTTKQKYWDLDYSVKKEQNFLSWKDAIRSKLQAAVAEQMVADVSVGAMLSGGIDSSIIVALMAEQSTSPINTFSVGFIGEAVSELPFADLIAKKFHTQHHEITISPEHIDILPELVHTMEEPFGDHGALPMLLMSRVIRKHVTVALNGDGGDENFAGYDRYTAFLLSQRFAGVSSVLQVSQRLLPQMASFDRIRRFISTLSLPAQQRYLEYVRYLSPRLMNYPNTVSGTTLLNNNQHLDDIDTMLYTDLHTYLPGALLPKVDMTCMAASLEARSPFLDHELLELSASMPSTYKIRGLNNRKYILKEISKDYIPESIINRKKRGFGVPLEKWFQEDLSSYAAKILHSPNARLSEYLPVSYITETLEAHKKMPVRGRQIWILLMLELWLQEFAS